MIVLSYRGSQTPVQETGQRSGYDVAELRGNILGMCADGDLASTLLWGSFLLQKVHLAVCEQYACSLAL